MITCEDIERAAGELQAANSAAEALGPLHRFMPPTDAQAAAQREVEAAAGRLEALTARRDAEQAEVAERGRREKAAGKYLTAAAAELEASRRKVAAAAADAQQALVALLSAGAEYDAAVCHHAADLVARGLPLDDEVGAEYETGGGRGKVRIRGKWTLGVDPSVVVLWVLSRVAHAQLPRRAVVWAPPPAIGPHRLLNGRVDGLLDDVPAVPTVPGA
ncbi:hypothetical protein [Actinomadura macrotermitis]|uniref:Uncharacterized protein n=1 Tax=Actinomadura macrotermitis TaxID=2585200 RepID=A0A7K0BSJ7_9ACTN|nr:hypothetical protein [Actinomadura macrotermitis]MQY04131.1 hypothetical protein [Actinomadura macrotermitis]